jgi:hypothetical protein
MGGREPTKTILIARSARKRIGEIKRIFLILRRDFLSSDDLKIIIEEKLLLHNVQFFYQHLVLPYFHGHLLLVFYYSEL